MVTSPLASTPSPLNTISHQFVWPPSLLPPVTSFLNGPLEGWGDFYQAKKGEEFFRWQSGDEESLKRPVKFYRVPSPGFGEKMTKKALFRNCLGILSTRESLPR